MFSLCRNVGFGNVLFLSVDGQAYRDIVNVFVGRVDKGDGDFVVLVFLVKNLVELNIFDVQVVCVFRLEDKEDRVGQCICSNLLKIAIDGLEVGKEKQGCFLSRLQFPGCPEDFGQGPGMGGDLKCGDGVDGLFLGKGREVLVVVGEKEKSRSCRISVQNVEQVFLGSSSNELWVPVLDMENELSAYMTTWFFSEGVTSVWRGAI